MLGSLGSNGVASEILSNLKSVTYFSRKKLENYTYCWAVLVGRQTFERISKVSNVQLKWFRNPLHKYKSKSWIELTFTK